MIVRAPWTDEQIAALTRWQEDEMRKWNEYPMWVPWSNGDTEVKQWFWDSFLWGKYDRKDGATNRIVGWEICERPESLMQEREKKT